MEEQQIQTFVHAVLQDEQLRKEFVSNPDAVIMREGFSPRLSRVIRMLVPCLEANQIHLDVSYESWVVPVPL